MAYEERIVGDETHFKIGDKWYLDEYAYRPQPKPPAPEPTTPQEDGVSFADYGRSIMAGGAQVGQGVGWLLKQAGVEDIGQSIYDLSTNAVEHWNEGLSDAAKDALSREFVHKNDAGEYEWGDASLNTVGLMGAQSLLGTGAGMGAGAGISKMLQVFANPVGRAALTRALDAGVKAIPAAAAGDSAAATAVQVAAAAQKKLKVIDKIIGAVGFGAGEGAVGGATTGVNVYQSVMKLSPEQLANNPRYQQVLQSTDEKLPFLERHAYAAETIANEASSVAGFQSGLTTALLGAPMGAFFGRVLGRSAQMFEGSVPRSIVGGAAGEAAQEFAQGTAEQLIANRQRAAAGEDVDLWDDVLNQALGGAVAGAALGGALGPLEGKAQPQVEAPGAQPQPEEAPAVTPSTRTPEQDTELREAASFARSLGVEDQTILDTVNAATRGESTHEEALDTLTKLGETRQLNQMAPSPEKRLPPTPTRAEPPAVKRTEPPAPAAKLAPAPAPPARGLPPVPTRTMAPAPTRETAPKPATVEQPKTPAQATEKAEVAAVTAGQDAQLKAEDIPEYPDLDEGDRTIERKFAQRLADDPEALEREYSALEDTLGGKMLNADAARELSPDYLADRTKSAAVHEPATFLMQRMYQKALATPPGPDEDAHVVFTAGGTGAGKTTSLNVAVEQMPEMKRAQTFMDSNLAKVPSATRKIDMALDAGKKVTILFTYRDPVDALVNGVLPRAAKQAAVHGTGRTLSLDTHAQTHVGSLDAVKQLAQHYAGNPNVTVQVVNNSLGRGKARVIPMEDLPTLGYSDVRQRLDHAIEAEYTAGRVPAATYQAITGRAPAPRPEVRAGDSAGTQPPDTGREQEAAPVVRPRTPFDERRLESLQKEFNDLFAQRRNSVPGTEAYQRIVERQRVVQRELNTLQDSTTPQTPAAPTTTTTATPAPTAASVPSTTTTPAPAAAPAAAAAAEAVPESVPRGTPVERLRQTLTRQIAAVSPLVDVRIAESPEEYGLPENTEGAYLRDGRTVVLFADNIAPGREIEVFTHEVGHLAIERSPEGLQAVEMVMRLAERGNPAITKLWNEVTARQGVLDKEDHAHEVVALMAERGDKSLPIQRLIASVRRWLRKLGLVREPSEAEVRALIARAMRGLRTDVNKALAGSPKLKGVNPASTDQDILDAIDEAIPADVTDLDEYLADRARLAPRESAGEEVIEGDPFDPAERETPKPGPLLARASTFELGDFTARVNKDGTLDVLGEVAEIRDTLPAGIVGRATKDGMKFTSADAARVRAAIEGSKVAYGRSGAVTEKLPIKDGKYLGAPERFSTPAKIGQLRKLLTKLTREGEPGRFWYERSSEAILRYVGGNKHEARKLAALLAIYSPQAKVDTNGTFALRAWSQHKAGQPIDVKTGVTDGKAAEAMADVDSFWSGEKTGNFVTNLLRVIDPTLPQGATIDMWMMRAAQYGNDAPTKRQYAFMENEVNRIARELGWEPQQVQAAIWTAMKARMENEAVVAATEAVSQQKGWMHYEYPLKKGKPQKTRVVTDDQAHRNNWLDHAMAYEPTAADTNTAKFDFDDALARHIGQVSWEARPGRTTGVLPGIHNAPHALQVQFQQDVQKALYSDEGVDLLAQKLGLLRGRGIIAPGVWQGEVSASTQQQFVMSQGKGTEGKDKAVDVPQALLMNAYAATLGFVLRQEGVGWHRPFYNGKVTEENGLDLDMGRMISPQEAVDLEAAIDRWMQAKGRPNWGDRFGIISTENGVRLVSYDPQGAANYKEMRKDMHALADGVLPTFKSKSFSSSGELVSNNWKENPNGQEYLSRISESGRPDLLGWVTDFLAPRVQAVFERYSAEHGWGNPGTIPGAQAQAEGRSESSQQYAGTGQAGGDTGARTGAARATPDGGGGGGESLTAKRPLLSRAGEQTRQARLARQAYAQYRIIDHQTGRQVGDTYADRQRASRRADKLDLEYGSVRYRVEGVPGSENPKPLLSRAAAAPPAVKAVLDRVLAEAPENQTLKDKMRGAFRAITHIDWLKHKQGMIDSFASIEEMEKQLIGGGKLLDASISPYKALLATKSLPARMAAIMQYGVPEYRNGEYTPVAGRKSVMDIFAPLMNHKDGNLLRLWEGYAAAVRSSRLINERNPDGSLREKLMSQSDINELMALDQKYPEFKTVLKEWNTFNQQMLDLAEEAGIIDPVARAQWAKHDYVPFYREQDDTFGEAVQGPRSKFGVAGQRFKPHKLEGGTSKIGNVFENMMTNTAYLMDASLKNRAMQRVVDNFTGTVLHQVAAPEGRKNVVSVSRNGQKEYYEVTDPLALAALTAAGYKSANFGAAWGFAKGSKHLLTSAITADPAFMLANLMRDTISNWVVGGASMNPVVPIMNAMKGIKSTFDSDPDLARMLASGALSGGFHSTIPEDIRKLVANRVPASMQSSVIDSPKKAWAAWQRIGGSMENANRIAKFKEVLANGGTVAEAAYQARDVLNFTMSGDYAAMQRMVEVIPFLNARVQGLYRLYRGAKDNKKAFWLKGMMLTAATLALALRNNDREEYEELKDYDKDAYWHFFLNQRGTKPGDLDHWRIPKPFEVGGIFATMMGERLMRTATGRDSPGLLMNRVATMMLETFAFNPTPQLVKPIVEQYANRSMFTGSPIVGMAEKNLQPEAQFTPWTSATMRELAEAMPDWAWAPLRSPARLEALIRGYTGTMGMYLLGLSDAATRNALGYPDEPSRKLHDLPVVRRFLASPNPRSTKYADQMYEMLDEANATFSTINRLRREQRVEQASELARENKGKLAARVRLNRIGTQVRNINSQIRLIQLNHKIEAQEKRARIDALVERKNTLTRKVAEFADVF